VEIGRNAPCPCGSGKKYKKCCLPNESTLVAIGQDESDLDAGRSPDAMLGDPNTPEGSLRRKILDFHHSLDPKGKDLRRASRKWDTGASVDYSSGEDYASLGELMDYYIHDYPVPPKNKYLLDLFHESAARSLSAAERSLLESWLDNRKACYEVQAIIPGKEIDLKDILTGTDYKVYSEKASRKLLKWDILYARLLRLGEGWQLNGTAPMIPRRNKDHTITYLRHEFGAFREQHPDTDLNDYLKISSVEIRRFISKLGEREPLEITTSTGELMTPAEALFDVLDSPEVQRRLEAMTDFTFLGDSSARPGGLCYDWLQRGSSANVTFTPSPQRPGAIQFLSNLLSLEKTNTISILGNLTLTDGELLVSCLSQERLDALVALLEKRLGALVDFKKSKRMPLETLRKESKERGNPNREEAIPPEIKTELVNKLLDEHYHHWKDAPLPAFGGLTPRQAAKDPARRGALIEVLKDMESIGVKSQ
jgi:hypothetical protein